MSTDLEGKVEKMRVDGDVIYVQFTRGDSTSREEQNSNIATISSLYRLYPTAEATTTVAENITRQAKSGFEQGQEWINTYYARRASQYSGSQPNVLNRLDYKRLWSPLPDNFPADLKIRCQYVTRGLLWPKRKVCAINSDTLDEIAKARSSGKFELVLSSTDYGKLYALIGLSFKALKDNTITEEEGKMVVRNLYLAVYITQEKLTPNQYKLFVEIDRYKARSTEMIKQAIARESSAIRQRYGMDVERDTKPIRPSSEIERTLTGQMPAVTDATAPPADPGPLDQYEDTQEEVK